MRPVYIRVIDRCILNDQCALMPIGLILHSVLFASSPHEVDRPNRVAIVLYPAIQACATFTRVKPADAALRLFLFCSIDNNNHTIKLHQPHLRSSKTYYRTALTMHYANFSIDHGAHETPRYLPKQICRRTDKSSQ